MPHTPFIWSHYFTIIFTDGGFTLSFSIPQTYPLLDPIALATSSWLRSLSFHSFLTRSPKWDTLPPLEDVAHRCTGFPGKGFYSVRRMPVEVRIPGRKAK